MQGFVNIIKPTGMNSTAVVSRVKKILGTKKVGHLGTLDPAASGVLPVAVGRATKFFDYFLNKDKVYVARVKFGIETDTLDSFGKIIKTDNKIISLDQIKSAIPKFLGRIMQTPPKYSAASVGGKRAYDLAREEIDFELKPKPIKIFSIDVFETEKENEFLFKVHCSAGTYIRTLMSDIAHEFDGICTTFCIIRTKSGLFDTSSAQTLDEFEKSKKLLSVTDVFYEVKKIDVSSWVFEKLLNGVKLFAKNFDAEVLDGKPFFAVYKGSLIGLYKIQENQLETIAFLYENEFTQQS